MTTIFGPDPVQQIVEDTLTALAEGRSVRERLHIDLKEEAGRRDRAGALLPGQAENEVAAKALAGEAACMANTPGGGALIVGVTDDGTLLGTDLDTEWLRHRIYQLTERRLTVDVRATVVLSTRLLVVLSPSAIEPVRWNNRIAWRVDDHYVEVDATTWHSRRMRQHYDWSAQPSNLPESEAREVAVALVRELLSDSAERTAAELSRVPTGELLRRLNAVTGDGMLTNAAALLLTSWRPEPAIDYIHRRTAGGDSDQRVRRESRSLVEQLTEVFGAAQANNPVRHVPSGLVIGQVRQLPERAVREAIVNGLAHRDWHSPAPTVVEHIGATLRVTSPGGFAPGVNPGNIITHPSKSRNPALTRLLAAIRVAEQEGIGVDRMVGDMLRLGLPAPSIDEQDGPQVVTSLVGQTIRESWMRWLRLFDDNDVIEDLRLLMIAETLAARRWIDGDVAGRRLQVSPAEAHDSLNRFVGIGFEGGPAVRAVDGTPADSTIALVLSDGAARRLSELDAEAGWRHVAPDRRSIALSNAAIRGRISTTELGSLVGAHPTNVGTVLRALEAEGRLEPSREVRRGAGFFYRYVGGTAAGPAHPGSL
ncbi:MAG: putative DNA binding domain-containing protein [Pseudonocardia sp.]|nr:putative DNA binding domain-containing protein [Pseudonocardia sp.]